MIFAKRFNCLKFVFSPICNDDAIALFDAVRSKEFPSSLSLSKIKTLNEAENWCSQRALDWEVGKCFVWTCRRSTDSLIMGQVSLFPQKNYLILAYWVKPEFWGQGLATQMCESLLVHIKSFDYQGSVCARVHSWNARSLSVLQKLGFKLTRLESENITEYKLEMVS